MSRRLSTVRSVHAGRVALLGHTATFLVMLAALPLADSGAQLWAQSIVTGSIEGVVRARDTRRPLADVIVRVEGTTRASLTGADGRFSITAVTPGTAGVVARRFGFADQRDSVAVRAGEVARLELLFTSEAAVVAPMVVSATRESQRRQDATVTIDVLDGEEVRRARAAHPSGLLNRLPGVHVSELSGEGHSLAMRSPISTKPLFLYLEDGIPTRATGFFNHNALYEVNLPQSGGLEIMKGPGTALYGSDAIGGVVNVLTWPARTSTGARVRSPRIESPSPPRGPTVASTRTRWPNGSTTTTSGTPRRRRMCTSRPLPLRSCASTSVFAPTSRTTTTTTSSGRSRRARSAGPPARACGTRT